MGIIRFVVFALDRVGGNIEIAIQGGGHFVLRGKGVRSAQHHVRTAVAKRDHKIRGFAGDVQACGNAQPLERLLLNKTLANDLQHRHLLLGPLNLALASIGQRNILYIALLEFCCSHKCAPYLSF